MSLHVEWTPAAERDLRRLDRRTQTRIRLRVTRFATMGEGDVRRLRGYEREWRLRVGQWRVRFTLSPDLQTLIVLRVLPRGQAYRT
jgi:mRNA interferase RelE/StbE